LAIARWKKLLHETWNFTNQIGPLQFQQILAGRPHTSQYVFTGKRGDRLNGHFVRARLKAATRALGLDSRLHFHSLRHTFASLLVQRGISLYHVQKLLGHSSPRVTEIYAHLGTSELSGSVEKLAIAG
jgi:site-specific recombinase XerD